MSSITDETGGVTQDQTVLRRVAMMQQDRLRAVDLSQAMKATARRAAQVVGEHELVEVRNSSGFLREWLSWCDASGEPAD